MKAPLAYLNDSANTEVPIELWRELFDRVGWPGTLVDKRQVLTLDEVLRALHADDLTEKLVRALESLYTLGTEVGREAILAAMMDRRAPSDMLPHNLGDREFALRLFLDHTENIVAEEVFIRASIHVQERVEHIRYNDFVGSNTQRVRNFRKKIAPLQEQMLAYCKDRDLGDYVEVVVLEDRDGAYIVQVNRTHHTQKPRAVMPGHPTGTTLEYRPVHSDLIRYDAVLDRLRIATRAPSMVEVYRRKFGELLFSDKQHFSGSAICNLSILQERGRAALENHGVYGVGHVWMTECLWERGDGDLVHIRSKDCFRHIEELKLPLSEGQLLQAKLKLEVVGKGTRPVTVSVRTPSRIEITQKFHEQLVDEFLKKIGIQNATVQSGHLDLWSLYPWRHPRATWRAVFGSDVDDLIARGILTHVQLQATESDEHPDAGNILETHEVDSNSSYGVSRMEEIPSTSQSITDTEGLELHPEQFRQYLRGKLALTGAAAAWDGAEVLDLGCADVGSHRLHLHYALREPSVGTGDKIRSADSSVLLIPVSPYQKSELAEVILDDPLPVRQRVIRDAIIACKLVDQVPVKDMAPVNTRVVVDSQLGKIWIDGVEIEDLPRDAHPFRFLEALAKQSPTSVSVTDLGKQLSEANSDRSSVVRKAKYDAMERIKATMSRAGRGLEEDPFPAKPKGHYRCIWKAYAP